MPLRTLVTHMASSQRFDWRIGPTFLLTLLQIGAILVYSVFHYTHTYDTGSAATGAIVVLTKSLNDLTHELSDMNGRMIRVETVQASQVQDMREIKATLNNRLR